MKLYTRNIFISISSFIMIICFEILPGTILSKFGFTNISFLPKVLAESGSEYFDKASNSLAKRDYQNAILYGQKGIDLFIKNGNQSDIKYSLIHTVIAVAKMESGDNEGAVDTLTKSIAINPDNYSYSLRGMARQETKDYKGSIQDFTNAIKLYKGDDKKMKVDSFTKRGYVRLLSGDYKGAIQDYTVAIEIFPEASFYMLRGYNKYLIGDYKGNCEDIFIAEKIGTIDQNEINKMKDNFKCLLFE